MTAPKGFVTLNTGRYAVSKIEDIDQWIAEAHG